MENSSDGVNVAFCPLGHGLSNWIKACNSTYHLRRILSGKGEERNGLKEGKKDREAMGQFSLNRNPGANMHNRVCGHSP